MLFNSSYGKITVLTIPPAWLTFEFTFEVVEEVVLSVFKFPSLADCGRIYFLALKFLPFDSAASYIALTYLLKGKFYFELFGLTSLKIALEPPFAALLATSEASAFNSLILLTSAFSIFIKSSYLSFNPLTVFFSSYIARCDSLKAF